MTDDLDAPLGRKLGGSKLGGTMPRLRDMRSRRWPVARLAFGLVGLLVLVAFLRINFTDDPLGGRPSASVDISSSRNTNQVAGEVASEPITANPPQAVEDTTLAGGPQITMLDDLPDDEGTAPLGVRQLNEFGVDPDLIEETQNGPIPHMAGDGRTPFSTYARAGLTPAGANGRPLIAIVVTGLGLNESSTLDAIAKLPDDVTLAFAPYGRTLQRTTAAARGEGHEMLLQLPLEPFDYPDNDPGPQTLLTGQPPRANLDKLFWLMARFGGYFGVMNHMGARFSASSADFDPVMEELGTRGLGYVDDGASNRSLAPQLAQRNRVPFAAGDAELDTKPSRTAILEKLTALEKQASERGFAVGVASALPVSIDTITEWASDLEERGILLVPVSALMK